MVLVWPLCRATTETRRGSGEGEITEGTDSESYRWPTADFATARTLEAAVNDLVPYHRLLLPSDCQRLLAAGREKMSVTHVTRSAESILP